MVWIGRRWTWMVKAESCVCFCTRRAFSPKNLEVCVSRSSTTCSIPDKPTFRTQKRQSWKLGGTGQLPVWGDPRTSYVVFRDHPDLAEKNAFVERVQLSGLCYMHGPIVLQHYLVQMRRVEKVHMLDMAAFLRQRMSAQRLQSHIWDNAGGDSVVFLGQILLQEPEPVISTLGSRGSDWRECLERFGPLLVSGMGVESAFQQEAAVHTGKRVGPVLGRHAMVLVGHRREGSDDRFLMQNWWKRKVQHGPFCLPCV
jgi:hypothetical protein